MHKVSFCGPLMFLINNQLIQTTSQPKPLDVISTNSSGIILYPLKVVQRFQFQPEFCLPWQQ